MGEILTDDGQPMIEEHELWIRNPVKCIWELIRNPTFREYMAYAPEKAYADKDGHN